MSEDTDTVKIRDPDRSLEPAEAHILERDGDVVKVELAEDWGSHGDAGDESWIPADAIIGDGEFNPREEDAELPDLPNGWQWASGSVSSGYYTYWFETEYRMGGPLAGKHGMGGYDGEVYWDKGGNGKHKVAIYAIKDASGDDPVVEDIPTVSRQYDTRQEALDAVPDLIESLKD